MTPATLTDEEISTELLVPAVPREQVAKEDGPGGGPSDTGDSDGSDGGDSDGTDGGDADGTDGGS